MSSVYAYVRGAYRSKERRHCYCYISSFSSYNNYRISSLMYLLAYWYSLPELDIHERTNPRPRPSSIWFFQLLMFKLNRQRRLVASTRWLCFYSRAVSIFFSYFHNSPFMHVPRSARVMGPMSIAAIVAYRQSQLAYHAMSLSCKCSIGLWQRAGARSSRWPW